MRSRIVLVLSVAATFALCGLSSHAAAAGTYDVTVPPCSAWGGWGSNGWANGIYCNGYAAFQLNSNNSFSVGPPGTYMWHKSPRLPDTTFLKTLKLTYLASEATGTNDHIQARACQRYAGQNNAWSGGPNGACVGAVFGLPSHNAFSMLTIGEGTLACATNCGGWQLDVSTSYTSGFVWLAGISATIGDNTVPAVSTSLPSHEISQGKWLSGNVEVGATGRDADGSGIASMAFYPGDPTLSVSAPASCDFSRWIPCEPSREWSGSFDTRAVLDGMHTGRYTATDPAGMTGQSPTFNYRVDNTKPDPAADVKPETSGMNGWSATNSFGASWVNGAEVDETATQSGIEKVVVDVEPTDPGTQSNPAPVTVPVGSTVGGVSATMSSVSGVTVPAVGRYLLRVQVVDRAGNVSDVGDESVVAIGFDPSAPTRPTGQSNTWISRDELAAGFDQEFSYIPLPGSHAPVCGFSHKISRSPVDQAPETITVPGGSAARSVRLPGDLEEAAHYIHLRAIACNGIASTQTESVEAKIDRTDPVPSIVGVQEGKWYRSGRTITLEGADALSGMSPAGPNEDDSRNGGYLAYTIDGIGPTDKGAPRGGRADITTVEHGEHSLHLNAVDVAGNRSASKRVTFGIDGIRPSASLARTESSRPTVLSAKASDGDSGVELAVIYVRGPGTGGVWRSLPTELVNSGVRLKNGGYSSATATARFPDTQLLNGTYDVRVIAVDGAGNDITVARFEDGTAATIANPSRSDSKLDLHLHRAIRSCGKRRCVIKRCSRQLTRGCYKAVRGRFKLVGGARRLAVPFKRGAVAAGSLSDQHGLPIQGQNVVVSTRERVSGRRSVVGIARTDRNGAFAIRVPAGMNRTVSARFDGTELREDAESNATLETEAKISLKLSSRHARTGEAVTFSGKAVSFDRSIPPTGKILALQFYAAKKWRPAIAIFHTDLKGAFKVRYRFDGSRVKAKIVFRVTAPTESSWGHVSSASKPVVIRLN
ncbi:MAG: Ig-like domain repeat protein [Thermoleophilaceae bacterium]|nr:Ig-like domain repeat protein [Thermoleophilaceae bacterium]